MFRTGPSLQDAQGGGRSGNSYSMAVALYFKIIFYFCDGQTVTYLPKITTGFPQCLSAAEMEKLRRIYCKIEM